MAGFSDSDDDVIADINMVPFIDICLVLLIIFMVTSSYIVQSAIEVDLPTAASGSDVAPSTIGIVVGASGNFALNGDIVTEAQLIAGIQAIVAEEETVQAIIAGDRNVDYGVIMDVIDIVKLNGVTSFALNVDREETE